MYFPLTLPCFNPVWELCPPCYHFHHHPHPHSWWRPSDTERNRVDYVEALHEKKKRTRKRVKGGKTVVDREPIPCVKSEQFTSFSLVSIFKCLLEWPRKMLQGKTARQDVGCLSVGRVMQALKERRDQDAWKVMIAFTKKQGTWMIDWCHFPIMSCKWLKKF